jgi:hypothetical protein
MYHGVDLLDLWRGKVSARKLLAYIDRLPSHSAFAEASAQDDEMAELFADQEVGPVTPRITEWTPERAELVKVNENLRALASLVVNALGGKGEPPKPDPRPETALDRLNARLEDASYNYLLERIEESQAREE